MPMDKFGRHLHTHRAQDRDTSDIKEVFFVTPVSGLYYETILSFFGTGALDTHQNYILPTGSSEYTFKQQTGTITNTMINPQLATVFINDEVYTAQTLIGKTLKDGDVLRFSGKHARVLNFYAQLILKMPIIVDLEG